MQPTIQTSTYAHGVSSLAVDGNTGTDFGYDGCVHTNPYQSDNWWSVKLPYTLCAMEVYITNRDGGYSEYFSEFQILKQIN